MTVYRVVGPRWYRGHQPGDLFEATLETRAEARAIGRGSIEIVEHTVPAVQNYTFPTGWLPKEGVR